MANKTEIYQLRLTPEEANAFAVFADRVGESRSRLLRKFIREAINAEPDLLEEEKQILRQAVYQLTGCARNLNQITAAIHKGKLTHAERINPSLAQVLEAVGKLRLTFNNTLQKATQRWVKPIEVGEGA